MNQGSRIVLTGGPGAGKTVIAEAIVSRRPDRFVLVPEAATHVYAAMNTRWDRLDLAGRRDVQRRIYFHQLQQEARIAAENPGKILLLDRGTVDGAAYWPDGPEDYWRDLGSALPLELARYDSVIWLESSAALGLYDNDQSNACRFEDALGAIKSGEVLKQLWIGHPRMQLVSAHSQLADKISAVESALADMVQR